MNKEIIEKVLLEISTPTGLTYSGDTTICNDEVKDIMNYINNLEQQVKTQQLMINKAIEYLTSYSSIHTIQFGTENDSLNDIELNKTLDEKTLNEMTNRYLKVHDKLLEILKEVSE